MNRKFLHSAIILFAIIIGCASKDHSKNLSVEADPGRLIHEKKIVQRKTKEKENLAPGEKAPNFYFVNQTGGCIRFHRYKTKARFKLILFWNSDCWNCIAFAKKIYSWHQLLPEKDQLMVFAVSLDNEYQKPKWGKRILEMPAWEHMIDEGGVDSEIANAYCVLYTPFMVLIDSKTNKIIDLPNTIGELNMKLKTQ